MCLTGGDPDLGEAVLAQTVGCGDLGEYECVPSQNGGMASEKQGIYSRVRQECQTNWRTFREEGNNWKASADLLIEKGVVFSLSTRSCDVDESSPFSTDDGSARGKRAWHATGTG
jgi:hypothetical protein